MPSGCSGSRTPAADGKPKCGSSTSAIASRNFPDTISTPWRFLPQAEATNNLELRTNAVAKNILVDENGMARAL